MAAGFLVGADQSIKIAICLRPGKGNFQQLLTNPEVAAAGRQALQGS